MSLRHQLAAWSPLDALAIARATVRASGREPDPRQTLEALLQRELGAERAILCGSGTQALQLAIALRLRQERDEHAVVALPAFCCYDVAAAAVGARARIALYDLDPDTLTPDAESLARAFASGARTAVVAPLYGMPVPWDRLSAIAEAHGATLIEDAAQGQGATWRGTPLGAIGAVSVVSFGRGKGWTGGGGGALLLRDQVDGGPLVLAESWARADLRVLATATAQWALGRPSLYGAPRSIPALGLGETVYRPPAPPRRMPRAAAALAAQTFERSRREVLVRRERAREWIGRLARLPWVRAFRPVQGGEPGFLRLPIRIVGGSDALLVGERAQQLGIERSYPTTLAALAEVADRLVGRERVWPGAEVLVHELVTLPTHSLVSSEDRARGVDLLYARGERR